MAVIAFLNSGETLKSYICIPTLPMVVVLPTQSPHESYAIPDEEWAKDIQLGLGRRKEPIQRLDRASQGFVCRFCV